MLTTDSKYIIDTIKKHTQLDKIIANSYINQQGRVTIRLISIKSINPKAYSKDSLTGLFSSWPIYQKGIVVDAYKNTDYITPFVSIEALQHYLETGELIEELTLPKITSVVLNAVPESEELNRLLNLGISIDEIKACSYQMPKRYGTIVRLYNSRPDKAEVPALFKTKRDVDQNFSHLKIKIEYLSGTSYRTGNRKIEFSYTGDIDLLQAKV